MTTSRDDLVELSDHVWQRLWTRLAGLTDEEYRWDPEPGLTTLAWRPHHIADLLREDRNGPWLGRPKPDLPERHDDSGQSADRILAELAESYGAWRTVLAGTTEESLSGPIGKPAGRFGAATRRSFALHVLDELIHHGAEVALLRDWYRVRQGRS